jgi:predicted nucleic acid-binding protein
MTNLKEAFITDSNVIIQHLNHQIDLDAFWAAHPCCLRYMSGITFTEMLSKSSMSDDELDRARQYAQGFAIVELPMEVREEAAAIRRARPAIKLPDAVIAASAIVLGAALLTRDKQLASLAGLHNLVVISTI